MLSRLPSCVWLYFFTLAQSKTPAKGTVLPILGWVFPRQLSRQSSIDITTGQPNVDNPSLSFPPQVILGCIKVTKLTISSILETLPHLILRSSLCSRRDKYKGPQINDRNLGAILKICVL